MVGTSLATKGGIASVINVYIDAGLFQRYPIIYLASHCDGNALRKMLVFFQSLLVFSSALIQRRVGLLHVHTASRASFWRKCFYMLLAAVARVPVVLHLHGAEFAVFYANECGPLKRWLIRFVFEHVDRVVVLSSAWQHWVKETFKRSCIRVVHNPVLVPRTPIPWTSRIKDSVLFLGRLGKRKGVYDLVNAAAQVAKTAEDFQLLLGGDGELDRVQALAKQLGIGDRVKLLGWVQGEEKERHLTSSMIFVLPSYHEGLPMSMLEAMAAGLPIISTQIGGIPEAVTDGVEGFLIEPGEIEALADRINRLLNDPDLAQRMGMAARRKVETTFSTNAIFPRLEELYDEFQFTPLRLA